ncbi:alpha-1,4-glucan--maltose-1-phosphate maltosyltransferase [Achromobacter pestifer]|nr:alpha-1,4-glucan--maltose-1-phosphate maltosyltransferase [Achromobacter pestifer]
MTTPSPSPSAPLRIFHAPAGLREGAPGSADAAAADAWLAHIRDAGFNVLLVPAPWLRPADSPSLAPLDADLSAAGTQTEPIVGRLARAARAASTHGLALMVRITLDRVAARAAETTAPPGWYRSRSEHPERDPRLPVSDWHVMTLGTEIPPGFIDAWADRLAGWANCGVAGFLFDAPQSLPGDAWSQLNARLRHGHQNICSLAWTPGLGSEQLDALRDAAFDGVFSSLPWWDYKSAWLGDEIARLRMLGPVLCAVRGLDGNLPAYPPDRRRAWAAALCGDGWMTAGGDVGDLAEARGINLWMDRNALAGLPRIMGGRDGRATLLVRDAADNKAAILALNPTDMDNAAIDWDMATSGLAPGQIQLAEDGDEDRGSIDEVPPAGLALLALTPTAPVRSPRRESSPGVQGGAGPRIAIECVAPAVDGGRHPVKCTTHERVLVQADLLMDGHDRIAGELRWRPTDESDWRHVVLEPGPNDRWSASFRPDRIGPHEFTVAAWIDAWQTFRHDLEVKHRAGLGVRLETQEGLALLRAAGALPLRGTRTPTGSHACATVEQALNALAGLADGGEPSDAHLQLLLGTDLARAMHELDSRPFETASLAYPLWVDRPQGACGAWYELFPRSQAREAGRHGTFDDVIARLPDIQEMGFDVLYLPPIHPIGQRNRKGRNNSLVASPDDVGSPYAIGASDGGHDAIEPKLGSLPDFLRLVTAASDHGMEIALDFAIQCSPDHPWLKTHPDWFSWRPDGSLRHAENPPKKYEDIVNVSFYGASAGRPRKLPLWRALRDVVLFWVNHGVRIFRVDNPHTKPLPFWRWLIAEVHAHHPDVIFLSEAFTRPKMMYRLAKVGFTQSYTYFTWRNEKAELGAYLEEISRPPAADFFRPHFFVNTPDINPLFLQTSGRPGFLIRAALAAMGSGLWGMYSGFELCESAPVPGKEEYLDSEKYELRPRDWRQPGNIRAEIARLNQIRRANPALQTHRGLTMAGTGNDHVLAFVKSTPGLGNVVLAAISLDPFHPHSTHVDVPFGLFGADLPGQLVAEDLLTDGREEWRNRQQAVTLSPDNPYRIWRLSLSG